MKKQNCNLEVENVDRAQKIGSTLLVLQALKEPVVVYMKKSPLTITAFFGVIYAGCCYVPIDDEMPQKRMELILENTNVAYLIYDAASKESVLSWYGKDKKAPVFSGW